MPQLPHNLKKNKTRIEREYFQGFSMVEMLVVIAITIILFAVTGSAFTGIRNSIALNEDVRLLAQDISWAQRSSMTLRREAGEYWMYGIGVDLSQIENGNYTIFKWCSEYPDYDPSQAKLRGELPYFDEKKPILIGNGNLPIDMSGSTITKTSCNALTANTLVPVSGRGVTSLNSIVKSKTEATSSKNPKYILFESVTGRAFMYDASGNLLNYAYISGAVQIDDKQVPAVISLSAGNFTKDIVVNRVSGQVSVVDNYPGDADVAKPIDDGNIVPPVNEEIPKDDSGTTDPIKSDPIILDPVKSLE